MKYNNLLDKLCTVWVGQTMYPGLVKAVDDFFIHVESVQYKNLNFHVKLDAITAISIDENYDTLDKYQKAKDEQDAKQKAAAEEYRKLAEEIGKDEQNASTGNRTN